MLTKADTDRKLEHLKNDLIGYGRLAVAFSGGVDSTFLLSFACETLGPENVTALTVAAPVNPPGEIEEARAFCEERGYRHIVLEDPGLLDTEPFIKNPPDRCYHCKLHIFSKLLEAADGAPLADGSNLDDMSDYRPGMRALGELGIISPLKDAQLTKAEIRGQLRQRDIAVWSKPACACLASRVPYGEPVTIEKVAAVGKAEAALRELGFSQVRVRCHGDIGRLEVLPEERRLLFSGEMMDAAAKIIRDSGFRYAALELSGYEMGSLNRQVGVDE